MAVGETKGQGLKIGTILDRLYLIVIWAGLVIFVASVVGTFTSPGRKLIGESVTSTYVAETPAVEWDQPLGTSIGTTVSKDGKVVRPADVNIYLNNGDYIHISHSVHIAFRRLNARDFMFTFTRMPKFKTVANTLPDIFFGKQRSPFNKRKPLPCIDATAFAMIPPGQKSPDPKYKDQTYADLLDNVCVDGSIALSNDLPPQPGDSAAAHSHVIFTSADKVGIVFHADIPAGCGDGPEAEQTCTGNPKAVATTPEISVIRAANMTIGSLDRYRLGGNSSAANDPLSVDEKDMRLNQGIYQGAITTQGNAWFYGTRYELSHEALDFGSIVRIRESEKANANITGSIILMPNSNLMSVRVSASNAVAEIAHDDLLIGGYDHKITPSDWTAFSSQPIVQYIWLFFATLGGFSHLLRRNKGD